MKDNHKVVLLPQTVEHVHAELTRMLENEQYQDAIEMLQFLLSCNPVDEQTTEEWKALLHWLEAMLPELGPSSEQENDEWSEREMYKQNLARKVEQNEGYVEQLINMLTAHTSTLDKQMLALEQLVYIEHPKINDTLIKWLCGKEMHPLVQFKCIQSLKARGVTGTLLIPRNGAVIEIKIEETPLHPDEFPAHIMDIMNKVRTMTEIKDPELFRFASKIWEQFISFIYGTVLYRSLANQADVSVPWAAALHATVLNMLYHVDNFEQVGKIYELTSELSAVYDKAFTVLQYFLHQMKPPYS